MEQANEALRKPEPLWRVWIDSQRRVVSFHEQENACLLEFHSQDLFWSCVNQYVGLQYRYQ
ncbi:MAG: hypothetical protein IJR54_06030 [Oscillibacter sp.]|nr:hypothetical protein [Oscillibacter sp.]